MVAARTRWLPDTAAGYLRAIHALRWRVFVNATLPRTDPHSLLQAALRLFCCIAPDRERACACARSYALPNILFKRRMLLSACLRVLAHW